MATLAQQYKELATKLMPDHAPDLVEGILDDDTFDMIDDVVYRRSEYLGGMAYVLLNIVRQQARG